jgi:large subunit ribosomal protein L5
MAQKKSKNTDGQEQKKSEKKSKEVQEVQAKDVAIPSRLYNMYKDEIVPALMKKLNYENVMEVPRLEKIVVNIGAGDAVSDPKIMEEVTVTLEAITGRKPIIRKAKKAISNFKLRAGMNIGAMVTLRREVMYEFLDRLINVALPRVRDFRGLSDKSFDGRGNYTFGVKEQIIFPEINVDKVNKILGMDITLVTDAKTDNEAFELLRAFGFPFRKKEMNKAKEVA